LFSVLGDAAFGQSHGSTAFGWMTLLVGRKAVLNRTSNHVLKKPRNMS
jgi:hypothetical protein